MPEPDLEQVLLTHVRRQEYKPVKPRVLAKALGLSEDAARNLKRTIKQLVKQGRLAYGPGHSVGLPTQVRWDGITGIFRRMEAGYGFVRPLTAPAAADKRDHDIHVPAKYAADASSGDTVLVRIRQDGKRRGKFGTSGVIVRVIERETHRFVGTYFEQAGLGLVEVDGRIFSGPILVGDPGAKGARPDDKVVIEMVRFPSHVHDGEGVILEVLGPRGAPGVDTLSIIHEFNLPGPFAEDALAEARQAAERFDESVAGPRGDFTTVTVITIDPEDARDFDDAISLELLDNGHWRLGVHVADVAHFVPAKTALDREALDRATSVYLPDQVIPMLPEIISNNLASLQPDRVRYTLSAVIDFAPDGVRTGVEVHEGAIRSCRRFTYEEVDDYLKNPAAWQKKLDPEVHSLLARMYELAMILRKRRFARGAIELTMPEVKIDLDGDGKVSGAHLVENTESHQIIEEFMLIANEAVAELLTERELLFLRRVHESPDPRKLKTLTEFVTELGFQTESLESRFAIQALLKSVHGLPHEHAVNYAVLRSMQKAVYSPEQVGHYALASESYCHFTSPIRRYPDLTVHRLLKSMLAHRRAAQNMSDLLALGSHCSEREQRAEAAERELTKVKLLDYMSARIGEEMEAVITGVENFGLFVVGLAIPAEGLIHVSSLTDDYYRYDRAAHTLAGYRTGNSFRLGDMVRVAVALVDIGRRELDFRLVRRLPHPAAVDTAHGAKKVKRRGRSEEKSGGERTRSGKPPAPRHKMGADSPARAKTGRPRGKKRPPPGRA
jgi:ribonuclease R